MMLKKLKVLRNIFSKPNSLFQLPNLTQSLVECTRVHPLSQKKKKKKKKKKTVISYLSPTFLKEH